MKDNEKSTLWACSTGWKDVDSIQEDEWVKDKEFGLRHAEFLVMVGHPGGHVSQLEM